MSVAHWRGVARAVIGLGWVAVGVLRQLSHPTYPAGDWGGDPTFPRSPTARFLVGVGLILSAAIPFIRESRSK